MDIDTTEKFAEIDRVLGLLDERARELEDQVGNLRKQLAGAELKSRQDLQYLEDRQKREAALTNTLEAAEAARDHAAVDSRARTVRCSELEYLLAQSKDNLNSVRRRCTELSEGLAQMQQIKDERVAALEHEVYKWTTIASQLRNKDANTSFTFSMTPWTVTGTQRKATA